MNLHNILDESLVNELFAKNPELKKTIYNNNPAMFLDNSKGYITGVSINEYKLDITLRLEIPWAVSEGDSENVQVEMEMRKRLEAEIVLDSDSYEIEYHGSFFSSFASHGLILLVILAFILCTLIFYKRLVSNYNISIVKKV